MSMTYRKSFLFFLLIIFGCSTAPAAPSGNPPGPAAPSTQHIVEACGEVSFQTASDVQFQADMTNALSAPLKAAKLPSANTPSLTIEYTKTVITPTVRSGLYAVRDEL